MNHLQGLETTGKLLDKFSVDLIYAVHMFAYYYMFYASTPAPHNLGTTSTGESKIVLQVLGSKLKVEIISTRLRCDEGFHHAVNTRNFSHQNILLSYKIKPTFELITHAESSMHLIIQLQRRFRLPICTP